MRQLTLNLRPERTPRFDNFVVGANREALDSVRLLACYGQPQAIYLWGEAGSGRSHLLQAAVADARANGRAAELAKQPGSDGDYPLPPGGLLCLDAADSLDAAGQAALFRSFIRAPGQACSLLIGGDAPPASLRLREDVRTRIGQCLVFELKPLDDGHKGEMLALYGLSRGLMLEPDLISWLLRHGRRDLPSLLAAIDTLDEASLARHRPPTLPLLRELMQGNLLPPEAS
ncbi:DnaA regulatory inactivator Hda [Niveibacterium sp. 24ML]|uniref:HdaA/DnaA family protein n=1 Tax=Niveibacterium sp. 24ML TaxID=2985512 RepID=UPI002270A87B|nr:DnaA regulatory inactivator Hda [Niveibacterium sp. 24ML]MCX9155277.1 DnaA regulatory inactivator Hda [Niveibacterium sp. 24ML]